MVAEYIPEQGDIIVLDFDPQTGHEQKGRRPAYVASNRVFHQLTNLAIVCPVTNSDRGYPLHVPLDGQTKTTGVIMCEQAKSLDLAARRSVFVEKTQQRIKDEVFDILFGSIEAL